MENKDRNKITLWRKFDRADNQPVAKGDGCVGENDFKVTGSMWPSRKGSRRDGSPWQAWNVSIRPAQGETRKLVAVPEELLPKVMALLGDAPESREANAGGVEELDAPEQEDLPF